MPVNRENYGINPLSGLDRDMLIIGGLLLLLLRDNGDKRLILALAYIIGG